MPSALSESFANWDSVVETGMDELQYQIFIISNVNKEVHNDRYQVQSST